jgi:hypothetical protein
MISIAFLVPGTPPQVVRKSVVRQMATVSVMCRAASKMVPNRFLFGDSFDRPGSSSEAF